MSATTEQPVVTVNGHTHKETHPAYGQITVHRGQGHNVLYGSDFVHQHCVSINVSLSELNRDISHDWPHARSRVLELRMSEAQWAAFVGGVGNGVGTQCTLEYYNGQSIPGIPSPKDRKEQFGKEMNGTLDRARENLKELQERIDGMSISKKAKDELHSLIGQVANNIGTNLNYVANQFDEHMENTVQRAKTEVHAFLQHHLKDSTNAQLDAKSVVALLGD